MLINPGAHYGHINWNVISMSIPKEATEIYVLGEPLKYLKTAESPRSNESYICELFQKEMINFISVKYPLAFVGK